MINPSLAMPDPDESTNEKQSSKKKQEDLKKKQKDLEDQIDNLASELNPHAPLLPSAVPRARATMLDLRSCLDRNRLIWYTTFASVGASLALSNAFKIDDIAGYTPFMLGGIATGVALGGTVGYMINKRYPNAMQYMRNKCINICGGLLSFVPWIVFGATKNKNNP